MEFSYPFFLRLSSFLSSPLPLVHPATSHRTPDYRPVIMNASDSVPTDTSPHVPPLVPPPEIFAAWGAGGTPSLWPAPLLLPLELPTVLQVSGWSRKGGVGTPPSDEVTPLLPSYFFISYPPPPYPRHRGWGWVPLIWRMDRRCSSHGVPTVRLSGHSHGYDGRGGYPPLLCPTG